MLKDIVKEQPEWSQEEDDLLRNLIAKGKRKSWTSVCKEMNKKFKVAKRTAKECRTRFNAISKVKDAQPWSKNEELVFLLTLYLHEAKWEEHVEKLINRKIENARSYFDSQIESVISQIKSMDKEEFKRLSPIEQLRFKVYLHFLINHPEQYSSNKKADTKISVREDDYKNCLERLGFENKQKLSIHINNEIEQIQNNGLAKLKTKPATINDELSELFHKRPEELTRQEIFMHFIPPEETNREHFLIAIYYFPNQIS